MNSKRGPEYFDNPDEKLTGVNGVQNITLTDHDNQKIDNITSQLALKNLSPKWQDALTKLNAYIEESKSNPEKSILYKSQLPIIEALLEFLESGGQSGYVSVPTGCGKTVIFSQLVEILGLRTLIVTSRSILVQQTQGTFEEFTSDVDLQGITRDLRASKKLELIESSENAVCTYSWFLRQIQAENINPNDWDLIIADEGHKALGKKTSKALSQFSEEIPVIGFTATPQYSKERSLKNLLENEIYGLSIEDAVKKGLLCSFSVLLAETETDLSNVRINNAGEYNKRQLEKAINVESRNQAAVKLYKQAFMGETAVAYCMGINHAKNVAEEFQKEGVKAEFISGRMSKNRIDEVLKKYKKGEIQVICNADILIEGFDAPIASICLNLRPTLSQVVAEQRGGRVLRINKLDLTKHAYIVDFVDKGSKNKNLQITYAQVAGGSDFTSGIGNTTDQDENQRPLTSVERSLAEIDIEGLKVTFKAKEVMSVINKIVQEKYEYPPSQGYLTLNAISDKLGVFSSVTERLLSKLKITPAEIYLDKRGRPRDHYAPNTFEQVKELHEKLSLCPSGWINKNDIANILGRKTDTISADVRKYINYKKGWGEEYYVKGGFTIDRFYPYEIITLLEERKVLPPAPDGWLSMDDFIRAMGRKAGGNQKKKMEKKLAPILEKYPNLWGEYSNANKQNGIFYSPELINILEAQVIYAPSKWIKLTDLATQFSISNDTLSAWVKEHCSKLPEPIKNFHSRKNRQPAKFVSPEAVVILTKYRETLNPKEGEKSIDELHKETGIQKKTLDARVRRSKIAMSTRVLRIGRNGKIALHYTPEAISLLIN